MRAISFVLLLILAVLAGIAGAFLDCTGRKIPTEQTELNLPEYENELIDFAAQKGLLVQQDEVEPLSRQWLIRRDDALITVRIMNSADSETEVDEGFESVRVDYEISNADSEIDLDLFSGICSLFSQKELRPDLCRETMDAPDWKYKNFDAENALRAKKRSLDFFENWTFYYYEYEEGTRLLRFCGLTKASVKGE